MSTIIKVVGQITLKALTDVESTTYYYLLQSSMAAAPSKPTTNPPTGGWSTTEPEFFIYMPTQDTTIIPGKDYYTRSGEEGSYIYTKVLEPSIDDISSYYEKIYGDTRSLYVTVQTLYTDNTFEYSQPSLSSSYEAAKEAYNRAKTALDLAGDTKQYFWEQPSQYSINIPAGVYVTHIPQSQFKVSTGPTQGNIVIQDTGLTIRNGAISLASLTGTALNFYKPGVGSQAPSLQLSNSALTIYNPSNNARTLMLDSSGLNFYGSNTSTADVTLDSNGLTLLNGSIKSGALVTPEQDGFLYLSPQVYTGTVSGHSAGQIPIDDYVKTNWRQIIGTKFAVDSDGNLYANNAHLSSATVEGAITATSLTISGGGATYDGASAINISGYDIVIYEDSTDESIIDHDNTTYLYPVMYHNGDIDNTVDNTHYIWYVDDGTIGTIGDAIKGGIIASYGHNYRVTYDFDDGAVGGGTEVQTRTVDPSKYITRINDTGITIHPEIWNNESSYIQLDGTGMELFDSNKVSIAQYGNTARIGKNNSSRFLMNADSLQAYNSNNQKYFEVNENGLTWGNNMAATTSQVDDAATKATSYLAVDSTGIMVYDGTNGTQTPSNPDANTNNVFIDENSLDIRKGSIVLATFGADVTQIGQTGESHLSYLEMDYHSMQLIDKEGDPYFYVSDLRDKNDNYQATITEIFIGDGTKTRFTVQLPVSAEVSATDSSHSSNAVTRSSKEYTFTTAPNNGATITIIYKTTSNRAKAYTFGTRSTSAVGAMSVVEGVSTTASGYVSHAEGFYTTASGPHSHAEGFYTTASGFYSHAEGGGTTASGSYSHAEGALTTASGSHSHAEGYYTTASGYASHAEGFYTTASGYASHAKGDNTTASGSLSHAEGTLTIASGRHSHASGYYTVANEDNQTVIGKLNNNQADTAFEIGNGTSDSARSNALTVDWNGQVQCQGISSLNDSYSEIFVGDYSNRAKQVNSSLTTSSADNLWLIAAITAICQDYPNKQMAIFKGRLSPNAQGYFELYIYDTSLVSGGLPQYSFGTWNKWQSTFWIISTNNYAFTYTAK